MHFGGSSHRFPSTGTVRFGRIVLLLKSHIMASFSENAYSLVHQDNAADQPTLQELKTHCGLLALHLQRFGTDDRKVEKGTDDFKVDTMKRILTIMLNGDPSAFHPGGSVSGEA